MIAKFVLFPILTLFIICIIAVVLKDQRAKSAKAKKGGRHPRSSSSISHASSTEKGRILNLEKEDRGEIYETESLKKRIQEGLGHIFSDSQPPEKGQKVPVSRNDLDEDLVIRVGMLVGDMAQFRTAHELSLMMEDQDIGMSQVSKKISSDPILSTRILKSANSSFFSHYGPIDSISHALAILGLNNIRWLIYHHVLSKRLEQNQSAMNSVFKSLWEHAILTSTCAFYVSDAFTGLHKGKLCTIGLLHDIGKFMLPQIAVTGQVDRDILVPFGEKAAILREDQALGMHHGVVGGIALGKSGLSAQSVKIIESHHLPSFIFKGQLSMDDEEIRYLTALYLSNQAAKLFVNEDEKGLYAVQSLPRIYWDLIDRNTLYRTLTEDRLISEILKAKSLASTSF